MKGACVVSARPRGRSGQAGKGNGGILLGRAEVKHLRAALGQMELLLTTRQVDAGFLCLVDLLRNLRPLRRLVA